MSGLPELRGRWSVFFCVCQWYECRMICVMLNEVTAKKMSAVYSLYFEWLPGFGNWSRIGHGTLLF